MQIDSLFIEPPVALAPMSGINDRSFRLICREWGARLEEHPICAQIFGPEPDVVSRAAMEAERRGADLIDINMGCSVPKVLKGRSGADLMADPERGEAIVRACVAVVDLPVLVKVRTGWQDKGEDAVGMALRCERAGAAAITVHPRWGGQQFRGSADWSVITRVKKAVRIPVIGSGDIKSSADAVRMRAETECDGVMIGRAALGNPWVFADVSAALLGRKSPSPPTSEERLQVAERHVRLAIADRGERVGAREMRKHVSWYLKGLPMARSLREKSNHATSESDLLAVLAEARNTAKAVEASGEPA